ncbi:MAG: LTA synthase family protein [Clostridiales bacterium]|nr:LTA synthase family protein [Clostridiales bacterium]
MRRKSENNPEQAKTQQNRSKLIPHIFVYFFAFLTILLCFSYRWCRANYGNIGMDEIIFTLSMSLDGAAESYIRNYLLTALLPAIIIFAVFLVILHIPFGYTYTYRLTIRTSKRTRSILLFPFRFHAGFCSAGIIACLMVLAILANESFGVSSYINSMIHSSSFIEENYIDPNNVSIEFPEEKRNLIWIYMESAESSTQDKENGGLFDVNYIPEMTQLAKDNISFSQSDLIEGASVAPACGWTIAGLVAQTAGLPLKLYAYSEKSVDNSMNQYSSFLPGATTLGDILEANGYNNYFMAGSKFSYGGRTNYFTQHGDYAIFDYLWAIDEEKISSDYYVWWGYEDEKLYAFAKEKLLDLADEDEPFNFSMITVDTHQPNGYSCDLCENTYNSQYANVWACASKQISEFVSWIQEQDFYENTTIIITGDHCSMTPTFYGEYTYDKHNGETVRKVYNVFINVDKSVEDKATEKNRLFTTMDFFPTALASLGVTIEGDRLGLGTNLFSETDTLSEEYGYEYLYAELNKKSVFYNQNLLYPSSDDT